MTAFTPDHDTTFEPFAAHEFYRDINKELVEHALTLSNEQQPLWKHRRVVDVACGTGAISRLVVDFWEANHLKGELVGFDPSETALERARQAVKSTFTRFVQGAAESINSIVSATDVVLFFNALHLVEDKAKVLQQIRNTLNTRGLFAFNSSFYDGAYADGTQRFYRQWMVKALQMVRREHPEMRTDPAAKSTAMRWLNKEQYNDLLKENGFTVLYSEERTASIPLEGWTDISGYSDFASGALPGIPLSLSVPALRQALRDVFHDMNLPSVPRNWYQVVAQRV